MRAGENLNDIRKCSACHATAYRQVIQDVGTRSYFGIQGLDIEDPETSGGEMVNGYFVMAAYVCTACGHLDFYSSTSGKKKR